ncbi:hypothetical protein PFISCL1PPCAC_3265, partial [Pristionchus fissidentatus]
NCVKNGESNLEDGRDPFLTSFSTFLPAGRAAFQMSSLLRLLFTYVGIAIFAWTLRSESNVTTATLASNSQSPSLSPTVPGLVATVPLQANETTPPPVPLIRLEPKPEVSVSGFRLDCGSTSFSGNRIVIPPDKQNEVPISIFGSRLHEVDKIELIDGDCSEKHRTVWAKWDKGVFKQHTLTKIAISYLFAREGTYVVCAHLGGDWLKVQEDRVISVQEVIVLPNYKFGYLWLEIVMQVVLHFTSALFSGLSLGLMTLTVRELEIIASSGSEKEQKHATAILPLRRKGNQLLCTLLMGNTICNTVIALIWEDVLPEDKKVMSILITTATVLLLGEILPQSICVNNALAMGARMLFFAKICMYVFFIFAWPISKILDWFVGEEHESYDRKRLMELMNRVIANNPEVVEDELKIAAGAMNLKGKIIFDSMTAIEDVFMLPETANLNSSAIAAIVRAGYTRIPVFRAGNKKDICDVLITKDLALIDPDDNYTVRMLCNIYKHPVPKMSQETTLLKALQKFKKGHDGHLAVVYQRDEFDTIGIITLEDVVEEILQEEIKDEFDLKREKRGGHEKILWDTTAPPAVMGKQLQTVTYQFCVANEEAFTERYIDKSIFERLMTSCTKSVDVHYLKPLGGALTVPIKQLPRCARLYTKDEMSDRYILILEGRAEVTIGQGGMKFEAGPFHRFGIELLQKLMLHADELCKREQDSTTDPKELMQFRPDYSVAVFEDCTFLEVSSDMYIKALRMTRLQRSTKNTAAVYANFKDRSSPTRRPLMMAGSTGLSKEKMQSSSREELGAEATGKSRSKEQMGQTAPARQPQSAETTESNREGG